MEIHKGVWILFYNTFLGGLVDLFNCFKDGLKVGLVCKNGLCSKIPRPTDLPALEALGPLVLHSGQASKASRSLGLGIYNKTICGMNSI